jgi:hypothetical protein
VKREDIEMRDDENRLALIALFLASARDEHCARRLDVATSFAAQAPGAVAMAAGIGAAVSARFGAVRTLNSLCAACGACERGRVQEEDAAFMCPNP